MTSLSQSMAELQEQKEIFETLFYDTSDGLLLMKNGIYTDCNNAAVSMLGLCRQNSTHWP